MLFSNSSGGNGLSIKPSLSLTGSGTELGREVSLLILTGIGLVLSSGVLYDVYADWIPEGKPLWSTLMENALPLLFALTLPYAAWLLARSDLAESYISETTKWALAGAVATLVVSASGVGLQLMQGELKPLIIVVQMTTAGAVAGILLGYSTAEIRQARAELEERESQMQSIAQNVTDGIFRYAVEEGSGEARLVYANRAFARMFGYHHPDEVIGCRPEDFRAGSSLEDTFFQSMEAKGRLDEADAEIEFQRKDGSTFTGRVTSSLVRDDSGDPVYRDGVIADITPQKERQQELKQAVEETEVAREEAEIARRLAEQAQEEAERAQHEAEAASQSKSQFLAGVAHDLRNPLSVIVGNARILESEVDEAATTYVHRIRNAADQISDMSSMLDRLSKLQSGTFSLEVDTADVRETVEEAVRVLRSHAEEEGIELHLDLPAAPARATVDLDSFRRVVDNLVGNAIKYSASGDRVTVRLSQVGSAGESASGDGNQAASGEGGVLLEVEDTGPGIEESFRADLFEPFARNQPDTDGTGLGLAITNELVDAMDGRIDVESKVGEGTCFRVRLPA